MNDAAIGITAARRAREQADLVRSFGGRPVIGSAIRADLPSPDEQIAPELYRALEAPLDQVVFLTGVGVDVVFDLAARLGVEPQLRRALQMSRVVARGPKPRKALRRLGIRTDWVVDPPSTQVILDHLVRQPLAGRRVLVLGYGPSPDELVAPLHTAGADVTVICPYRAAPPDDVGPARTVAAMAATGQLAAVTFTSAGAVEQFLRIAAEINICPSDLTARGALMAAIGPVTADAMRSGGLCVGVMPEIGRMGALYRSLQVALKNSEPRISDDPYVLQSAPAS